MPREYTDKAHNDVAVVFDGQESKKVHFTRLAGDVRKPDMDVVQQRPEGYVVVLNMIIPLFEGKEGQHDDEKRKLIDGVAGEIAAAHTSGYGVIYLTTSKKILDFAEEDVFEQFPKSDDDYYYTAEQANALAKFMNDQEQLKRIRLVGLVQKRSLNAFVKKLDKRFIIETENDFLAIA